MAGVRTFQVWATPVRTFEVGATPVPLLQNVKQHGGRKKSVFSFRFDGNN